MQSATSLFLGFDLPTEPLRDPMGSAPAPRQDPVPDPSMPRYDDPRLPDALVDWNKAGVDSWLSPETKPSAWLDPRGAETAMLNAGIPTRSDRASADLHYVPLPSVSDSIARNMTHPFETLPPTQDGLAEIHLRTGAPLWKSECEKKPSGTVPGFDSASASASAVKSTKAQDYWDANSTKLIEYRTPSIEPRSQLGMVSGATQVFDQHLMFDQGGTSACVPLAFVAAFSLRAFALFGKSFTPSPSYLWWYTRKRQCDLGRHACGCDTMGQSGPCVGGRCRASDCPTHLKTAAEVMAGGVPPETVYPWPASGVWDENMYKQPPAAVQAMSRQLSASPFPVDVKSYGAAPAFKDLLNKSVPVVLSISLSPTQVTWFNDSKTSPAGSLGAAKLPMAGPGASLTPEGHAFVIMGYIQDGSVGPGTYFVAQDSHGATAHYKGFFLVDSRSLTPEALIESYAMESICVRQEGQGNCTGCAPWTNAGLGRTNLGQADLNLKTLCNET